MLEILPLLLSIADFGLRIRECRAHSIRNPQSEIQLRLLQTSAQLGFDGSELLGVRGVGNDFQVGLQLACSFLQSILFKVEICEVHVRSDGSRRVQAERLFQRRSSAT